MKRLLSLAAILGLGLATGPAATAQVQQAPILLKSLFQGDDMCLSVDTRNTDGYRTRMTPCTGAADQRWIPVTSADHDDEYVTLVSAAHESLCLDGRSNLGTPTDGPPLQIRDCRPGAAMQLWTEVDTYRNDSDYSRITTLYFENQGADRCLESSGPNRQQILDGRPFMDTCQDVTGQYWKAEPAGAELASAPAGDFPIAPVSRDIELVPDRRYYNASGSHYLKFQSDGNLVVYTRGDQPIWALNDSGTNWRSNVRAKMQADGNLVTYASRDDSRPTWSTDTYRYRGAELVLDDAGSLRVVSSGRAVWSSH
ncbi:MAG: hypothetical protein HKN71_09520 [Gemmatimonadetes bacterium]|nr:hypothetical protein [Gemmatimonadota bacterium]